MPSAYVDAGVVGMGSPHEDEMWSNSGFEGIDNGGLGLENECDGNDCSGKDTNRTSGKGKESEELVSSAESRRCEQGECSQV